jgi:hypothetical protein
VPQCNVLGPIVLLDTQMMLILLVVVNTRLQLFADDVKLYNNINTENASLLLRKSLDSLAIWAREWQLFISINKCAAVSLSSKLQPASRTHLY